MNYCYTFLALATLITSPLFCMEPAETPELTRSNSIIIHDVPEVKLAILVKEKKHHATKKEHKEKSTHRKQARAQYNVQERLAYYLDKVSQNPKDESSIRKAREKYAAVNNNELFIKKAVAAYCKTYPLELLAHDVSSAFQSQKLPYLKALESIAPKDVAWQAVIRISEEIAKRSTVPSAITTEHC